MAIDTVTVTITDFDPANDLMYVQVGLFGHPVRISAFRAMMSGADKDAQHLIRNLAVRAGLAGVDGGKLAALKLALEGVGFKY